MPNYLAQVTLYPTTNVVADATINTFSCSAADNAGAGLFADALIAGYKAMNALFPTLVRGTGHTVKVYDRADAVPRAPAVVKTWDFTLTPAGAPCPPEVALCLSFQGNPASGIPQARRRGRVYIGPLDVSTIDTTGRPTTSAMNSVKALGQSILDASEAAAEWEWTIWSTVTPGPTFVTNGWVDDEFDTQRRRGRKPTTRLTFL